MMKNLLTSFFFLLVSNLVFGQVEWAPVGAKWWQIVETGFDLQRFVTEYECTAELDTLGHSCKIIHESSFDGIEQDFITYQDGELVYFYMGTTDGFVRIYDYSKQAGESYSFMLGPDTIFCEIDSITLETYNGNLVQVQHAIVNNPAVPFGAKYTKIYTGIGSTVGLGLTLPTAFTPEVWWWLSCFQPPNEVVFSINEFPDFGCQSLSTSVSFVPVKADIFTITPNPVIDYLNINIDALNSATPATFRIINVEGRLVKEFRTTNLTPTFIVPVVDWPSGVYWLQMEVNATVVQSEKFIKQ